MMKKNGGGEPGQAMINEKAVITTRNEAETYRVGETLGGQLIDIPLVITLDGKLGTGKTVMVKGAAKGLGSRRSCAVPHLRS